VIETASRLLLKHGEQRDEALSQVYGALAKDYMTLLKAIVSNRTPSKLTGMGAGILANAPLPWPAWMQKVQVP
jgi:hypothetical protein